MNETQSENEQSSTQTWLSVSQAAAALGISERQARRYAGRLAGHNRQEAGHEAGRVATLVRLSAMQELRTKSAPRNVEPDTTPDTTPDTSAPKAGREAGHIHATPDSDAARAMAERECELLRDALQRERENADQWRAQVEAANRDAAELRAALRTALAAMPKQLTSGNLEQVGTETPDRLEQVGTDISAANAHANLREDALQSPQTDATGKDLTSTRNASQNAKVREMRPLWKVILGVR